jgi:hypothetical protein
LWSAKTANEGLRMRPSKANHQFALQRSMPLAYQSNSQKNSFRRGRIAYMGVGR